MRPTTSTRKNVYVGKNSKMHGKGMKKSRGSGYAEKYSEKNRGAF
jgi:hypothetical protein